MSKVMQGLMLFTASLAATAAAPVAAQPVQIDQIGSRPAATAGEVPQVSSGARDLGAPQSPDRGRPPPPAQLSAPGDARPASPQLTGEIGRIRASNQVYRGGPTAQQPDPLSSPAEGRTGAVARVEGNDRCDPRAAPAARDPACARIIEKRAAEFSPQEAAPLSAEQRLLADQRMREPSTIQSASRRLANGEVDPDSPEAQGLASVVLGTTSAPPPPEKSEPTLDQQLKAAEAIIGAIVNLPPR